MPRIVSQFYVQSSSFRRVSRRNSKLIGGKLPHNEYHFIGSEINWCPVRIRGHPRDFRLEKYLIILKWQTKKIYQIVSTVQIIFLSLQGPTSRVYFFPQSFCTRMDEGLYAILAFFPLSHQPPKLLFPLHRPKQWEMISVKCVKKVFFILWKIIENTNFSSISLYWKKRKTWENLWTKKEEKSD